MIVRKGVLISVTDRDIKNGTFDNWEGIYAIGPKAFYNVSSLKQIRIPFTITSIEDEAFLRCTNLKSVEISESVKTIKK